MTLELPIPSREAVRDDAFEDYRAVLNELPSEIRARVSRFVDVILDDRDERVETLRLVQVRQTDPVAVEGRLLGHGIALIDVRSCGDRTRHQFADVLQRVLAESPTGLVLDIRWCVGGRADVASAIVSHFIPKGSLVAAYDPALPIDVPPLVTAVTPDAASIPLTVLINAWSASTAELVAAALQHYGRATLIGSRSFGKPLADIVLGSGDRITTGAFARPDGSRYDMRGLEPDVAATDTAAVAKAFEVLTCSA